MPSSLVINMNLAYLFILKIAVWLEIFSSFLKNKAKLSKIRRFIDKYNLTDGIFIPKKDRRYNPYEGTNLILIDKLILLRILKFSDIIMDVGAGAGILLFYLSTKGFNNLYGIEQNQRLIDIFKMNIDIWKTNKWMYSVPKLIEGNAIQEDIPSNINCFFFYNPFHDEQTYIDWICLLKKSLRTNKRSIKLIFLYPTLACYDAISKFSWLIKKERVICKEEVCYKCIKFVIYTNDPKYDY